MLRIKNTIVKSLIAHAQKELPYEACGYLASDDDMVVQHYELTNIDMAADHFNMDPAEQFAAVKDMREKGLRLCAVYHSHPETPARPSVEDIKLAYDPNITYVIISLASSVADIKSFRIQKGKVLPVSMEIFESEETQRNSHKGGRHDCNC